MLRRADLYTVSLPLLFKEELVNTLEGNGMFCEYCFMKHYLHPVIRKVIVSKGTAVAQWLRCCATNQKVTVSIPDGVMEFFIDVRSKSF
jgi:hypothetical protein